MVICQIWRVIRYILSKIKVLFEYNYVWFWSAIKERWGWRAGSEFRSRCVKVSRGRGRPGLSVLMSLTVSADVKQHWTMLTHWSQFVPNMSTDIRGHEALHDHRAGCGVQWKQGNNLTGTHWTAGGPGIFKLTRFDDCIQTCILTDWVKQI